MVADCASTTRLESVQKRQTAGSAHVVGICVAAATAMHLTLNVTMTQRRSDNLAASALLRVLVRALQNALWWKFLRALAASQHV